MQTTNKLPIPKEMAPKIKEFGSYADAWNWESLRLPKRIPISADTLMLESAGGRLNQETVLHVDIGAGKGHVLDEVRNRLPSMRLESIGSEKFLYEPSHYRAGGNRIVSPQQLRSFAPPASARLVTVIAPDPFAPNYADQLLTGINQVHRNGTLFFRSEYAQRGVGLLLAFGFNVVSLGRDLSRTLMRSSYIPSSPLFVAWKDNPLLQTQLAVRNFRIMRQAPGVERLKLFARALSNFGAHRRRFSLESIAELSDLTPSQVRKEIKQLKNESDPLACRRFELHRSTITF